MYQNASFLFLRGKELEQSFRFLDGFSVTCFFETMQCRSEVLDGITGPVWKGMLDTSPSEVKAGQIEGISGSLDDDLCLREIIPRAFFIPGLECPLCRRNFRLRGVNAHAKTLTDQPRQLDDHEHGLVNRLSRFLERFSSAVCQIHERPFERRVIPRDPEKHRGTKMMAHGRRGIACTSSQESHDVDNRAERCRVASNFQLRRQSAQCFEDDLRFVKAIPSRFERAKSSTHGAPGSVRAPKPRFLQGRKDFVITRAIRSTPSDQRCPCFDSGFRRRVNGLVQTGQRLLGVSLVQAKCCFYDPPQITHPRVLVAQPNRSAFDPTNDFVTIRHEPNRLWWNRELPGTRFPSASQQPSQRVLVEPHKVSGDFLANAGHRLVSPRSGSKNRIDSDERLGRCLLCSGDRKERVEVNPLISQLLGAEEYAFSIYVHDELHGGDRTLESASCKPT